jgi:hypothetical protein
MLVTRTALLIFTEEVFDTIQIIASTHLLDILEGGRYTVQEAFSTPTISTN